MPRAGRRVLFWGHGYGQHALVAPIRTALAKRADAIVCYSAGGRNAYIQHGVEPEKVFVAPNTIFVFNASIGPITGREAFTFVGRLSPRKRIHELLEAFARARDHLPRRVRIEIVGDGPMRAELENLARDLQIHRRVYFWGTQVDESFLRDLFHRSIAYVSPGSVGLSVVHSFAYGVPVVTRTDVHHGPESENLEHGVNALLYSGGSEMLANQLVELASDPLRSYRLGANGYDHYVGNRSIDCAVAGFAAALRYVLSKS